MIFLEDCFIEHKVYICRQGHSLKSPFMMTREEAKAHFVRCGMQGWIPLLDLLYDALPADVQVTEVFEKWATFTVRTTAPCPPAFKDFIDELGERSMAMCETCGEEAYQAVAGSWLHTFCPKHHEELLRKQKPTDFYEPFGDSGS